MPRGGISCVLALALGSAACADAVEMPDDRVWTAGHVRYHAGADDDSCSAIAETADWHARSVSAAFGLPLDESVVVDYSKCRNLAALEASQVCPSRAAACSHGRMTWSSAALDRHELTHAYFSSLPSSHHLFEEGIAEALSCPVPASGAPTPWTSPEHAFATRYEDLDDRLYAQAGHFVGFLVNRYGPERFVELYRAVEREAELAAVALQFEATYGLELADAWQAAAMASPEQGCVRWWECLGPALSLGEWQPLGVDCDQSDVYRTVEVASRGTYLFQTLPDSLSQLSSCDPERPVASEWQASATSLLPLEPGRYFVGSSQPGWSVRLDEAQAVSATGCGDAEELNVLAAAFGEGVTVYVGTASTRWVKLGGLALIEGDLRVEAPPEVRVRGCQGCDESAGSCVELAPGEPFIATAELVFEIDASQASSQDRWFRLKAGDSAP